MLLEEQTGRQWDGFPAKNILTHTVRQWKKLLPLRILHPISKKLQAFIASDETFAINSYEATIPEDQSDQKRLNGFYKRLSLKQVGRHDLLVKGTENASETLKVLGGP